MTEHITSVRTYFLVFIALMVLTAITVWVSFQDFGAWNDVVALTIAVIKASLVVLFFMHIYYSTRLSKLVVVSGLVWLFILIGLTLSDYLSRGLVGLASS
ncbi:MAG: cytochrome C oxidase subunit IV family protein [Thermoanaerobaculia bacterium]